MSARLAETPLGRAGFDHGAQYFTARDPAFRERVERWRGGGHAAPWPAAGPEAWVGTPAMDAPVREMAGRLDVRWSARVAALGGGPGAWRLTGEGFDAGPFDAAVIALPAEQAVSLLAPWSGAMAERAATLPSEPCWTVMAAFPERLPVETDILHEDGPIGWAARDRAKPGRQGPEAWVIQAGPLWSRAHLEDAPEAVTAALLAALAERAGPLPRPVHLAAHRWRYARSGRAGDARLWDPLLRLGACGDWLIGPRVEAAWLSGDGLARAMLAAATR